MPSYDASFTVESSEDIQDVVSDLADRVPTQDRYLFNTVCPSHVLSFFECGGNLSLMGPVQQKKRTHDISRRHLTVVL
jgi:hypothetical protein